MQNSKVKKKGLHLFMLQYMDINKLLIYWSQMEQMLMQKKNKAINGPHLFMQQDTDTQV